MRNIMYDAKPLAEMDATKAKEYLQTAHKLVGDTRVADLRYQIIGAWLMQKYAQGDKKPYLDHMNTFKLPVLENLGCGMWCFDPGGTRFYERKPQVHPERSLKEQLDMAKAMKSKLGLQILQAHYANKEWAAKLIELYVRRFGVDRRMVEKAYLTSAEVDEETISLYKKCAEEGGPVLKHVAGFTFKPAAFEFGGLTNPIPEIRKLAQENLIGSLRFCKKHYLDGSIWWPGGDGFRNQHGVPFISVQDYAAGTVAEALDEVPGVPLFLETKGYEPAMNNHLPTTMEGILFAQKVESRLKNPINVKLLEMGIPIVQLQPEVGHERMMYQKIAKVWGQSAGRLVVSHENDQPEGNFDQDRCPGTIDRNGLDARLYTLMQMGYRGDFVLDIMPEVIPIETAVEIAVEEYKGSLARIARQNHEVIMDSRIEPDKHRGQLELVLAKAANPSRKTQ